MYLHSKVKSNMKKPVCITRAVIKATFKTSSRCTSKYLNSPFYKGTILWNNLDVDLQRAYNVTKFMEGLNRLFTVYQELW